MTDVKTEIEPYITQGRIALQKDASLKGVQEAMLEPYQPDVARTAMVAFPPVPKPVVLDEAAKKALRRLKDVFGGVQPAERRSLTEAERTAVEDERQTIATIIKLLEKRGEDLKEIIRHHMDVDAEERNVAVPKATVGPNGEVIVKATERDDKGHYILSAPQNPERSPIPGTNEEWSREYVSGSVTTSPTVIVQMLEDGEIDRATYLAMTKEVRVFDEAKAMDNAVHKPEVRDGILKAIKKMTGRSKPRTSLFTRKAQ